MKWQKPFAAKKFAKILPADGFSYGDLGNTEKMRRKI
jgi:hypothetical protein